MAAVYPQNQIKSIATVSAANTNLDGTGTLATIHTGVTGEKHEITAVYITATAATTKGAVRIWIDDGTLKMLVGQALVPDWTPTTTEPQAPVWSAMIPFSPPIPLPATSDILKASTHVAETFRVMAVGNKYS